VFDPLELADAGNYVCEALDDFDLSVAQSPEITLIVGEALPAAGVAALVGMAVVLGVAGLAATRKRAR